MSDTQQNQATLLHNKVTCLTSQVAQRLMSRATELLDRNHLYFSAIFLLCCRAVIGQLFVYAHKFLLHFLNSPDMSDRELAINKALVIIMSSSVSLKAMFVR